MLFCIRFRSILVARSCCCSDALHLFPLDPFSLPLQKKVAGSIVAGRADMVEMLQFAADKGIAPMIQEMPLEKVCAHPSIVIRGEMFTVIHVSHPFTKEPCTVKNLFWSASSQVCFAIKVMFASVDSGSASIKVLGQVAAVSSQGFCDLPIAQEAHTYLQRLPVATPVPE